MLKVSFPVIWLPSTSIELTNTKIPKYGAQVQPSSYEKEISPQFAILPIHKLQERIVIGNTHESFGVKMAIPPKKHL